MKTQNMFVASEFPKVEPAETPSGELLKTDSRAPPTWILILWVWNGGQESAFLSNQLPVTQVPSVHGPKFEYHCLRRSIFFVCC